MEFERSYFVNSPLSNYEDYRTRKFSMLAQELIQALNLTPESRVLDFGCATGGLLHELKRFGITQIKGTDISYWAISYGKKKYDLKKELEHQNIKLLTHCYDVILFLDVLEHCPLEHIRIYLQLIQMYSPIGTDVVVRVPLAECEGGNYVLEVSRNDVTHIQCQTRSWWIGLFHCFNLFNRFNFYNRSIYDSEGVLAGVFRLG